MLENLMNECSNYFIKYKIYQDFEIVNGNIKLSTDITKKANYIMLHGSVFNDGVYKIVGYENGSLILDTQLTDEIFQGYLLLQVVPKAFIDLSVEIAQFDKDNPISNLQSESIPNYSYTVATVNGKQGWQYLYNPKLKRFKKLPKNLREVILRAEDYA